MATEKQAFTALSVFYGGCTIDALEKVLETEVEDDVESLVDKSLVQVDIDGDRCARYRLLGPMREFASSELSNSTASDDLLLRHFRLYSALAKSAALAGGDVRKARFEELDREVPNVRAALEWASGNDLDGAAQLAVDLAGFWRTRGSFTEGRASFARLLGINRELGPRLRASLLRQSAAFATMQDDYDQSTELAYAALNIYRTIGTKREWARRCIRSQRWRTARAAWMRRSGCTAKPMAISTRAIIYLARPSA